MIFEIFKIYIIIVSVFLTEFIIYNVVRLIIRVTWYVAFYRNFLKNSITPSLTSYERIKVFNVDNYRVLVVHVRYTLPLAIIFSLEIRRILVGY